jgi:predicted metalloprotease
MAQFVSVVLKDTETIWGKVFQESGSTYRQPTLVLYSGQVGSACAYATASATFHCPGMKRYILI